MSSRDGLEVVPAQVHTLNDASASLAPATTSFSNLFDSTCALVRTLDKLKTIKTNVTFGQIERLVQRCLVQIKSEQRR